MKLQISQPGTNGCETSFVIDGVDYSSSLGDLSAKLTEGATSSLFCSVCTIRRVTVKFPPYNFSSPVTEQAKEIKERIARINTVIGSVTGHIEVFGATMEYRIYDGYYNFTVDAYMHSRRVLQSSSEEDLGLFSNSNKITVSRGPIEVSYYTTALTHDLTPDEVCKILKQRATDIIQELDNETVEILEEECFVRLCDDKVRLIPTKRHAHLRLTGTDWMNTTVFTEKAGTYTFKHGEETSFEVEFQEDLLAVDSLTTLRRKIAERVRLIKLAAARTEGTITIRDIEFRWVKHDGFYRFKPSGTGYSRAFTESTNEFGFGVFSRGNSKSIYFHRGPLEVTIRVNPLRDILTPEEVKTEILGRIDAAKETLDKSQIPLLGHLFKVRLSGCHTIRLVPVQTTTHSILTGINGSACFEPDRGTIHVSNGKKEATVTFPYSLLATDSVQTLEQKLRERMKLIKDALKPDSVTIEV